MQFDTLIYTPLFICRKTEHFNIFIENIPDSFFDGLPKSAYFILG